MTSIKAHQLKVVAWQESLPLETPISPSLLAAAPTVAAAASPEPAEQVVHAFLLQVWGGQPI